MIEEFINLLNDNFFISQFSDDRIKKSINQVILFLKKFDSIIPRPTNFQYTEDGEVLLFWGKFGEDYCSMMGFYGSPEMGYTYKINKKFVAGKVTFSEWDKFLPYDFFEYLRYFRR